VCTSRRAARLPAPRPAPCSRYWAGRCRLDPGERAR
jgi:hypothetical protein